jgi:hypothetical protein
LPPLKNKKKREKRKIEEGEKFPFGATPATPASN